MEKNTEYVFSLKVSSKEIQKMAKEIFENFPEYGQYSFRCTHYNYDDFIYIFEDTEEPKKYAVTLEMASKGLLKFISETLSGNISFSGLKTWTDLMDTCNYDVDAVDAILQYAIFNEIVYS